MSAFPFWTKLMTGFIHSPPHKLSCLLYECLLTKHPCEHVAPVYISFLTKTPPLLLVVVLFYLPFKEVEVIELDGASKWVLGVLQLLRVHVICNCTQANVQYMYLYYWKTALIIFNINVGFFSSHTFTFLPYEPLRWLQVPDAGALIFGVIGTLPGVPQDLGEGHFKMLLHGL